MPIQTEPTPKADLDTSVRTPDKDSAFKQLEQLRETEGLVGKSYKDLAEYTEYSRGHIQNVLNEYYNMSNGDTENRTEIDHIEITIPDGVDKESYLRGWFDAYID